MFVLLLLHNQSILTRKIVISKLSLKIREIAMLVFFLLHKCFDEKNQQIKFALKIKKNFYFLGTSTCGTDQGLRDTCPQV